VRSVDFVRINLQSNLALTLFGISLEENLLSILEKISQSMVACVFLIDYTHKDQFEFLNYIFNRIVQIYPVPFVVGLTNVKGDPEKALKEVRKQFTLPENIEFVTVEVDSFGDVRKLVYGLRKVEAEIEEGY
jgi:signal recognition particle receptor subunit beta